MSKAPTRRAVVDLKARGDAYGEIYAWLFKRYDRLLGNLESKTPSLWEATAQRMINDGVRSQQGSLPNRKSVQRSWLKVAAHKAEAVARSEKKRAASPDRGHTSRPPGSWTPPEHNVPQAQPSRSIPKPGAPAHAHSRVTSGQALRSSQPAAVTDLASALKIEGDDPFANLTPEETAELAKFGNLPFQAKLSVLRTFRQAAYADRFLTIRK